MHENYYFDCILNKSNRALHHRLVVLLTTVF